MANNILASISEMLTPDIIGKLAAASGLDRTTAGSAIGAALPALLSSMADIAATPVGARKLTSAVAQQSSDLESLSNHLTGTQSADHGNDLLSSILGRRTTNIVAAGIASLLGARANSIQTLVGMVAPFLLGGLRRLQSMSGLDGDGLARMLVNQKDSIAQAIPEDLSSYLRRSIPAEGAASPKPQVRAEVPRYAAAAVATPRRESEGAKGMSWPYWALAIAALGGLLWAITPSTEEHSKTAAVPAQDIDRSKVAAAARGNGTYIVRPDSSWRSIGAATNAYVNRTVYSAQGEEIGTVRDIMMGSDGKAAAAVIGVGRYLGLGDKVVAVPFNTLRTEQRDGNPRLVVDLMKEALQTAPQYENTPASKQ
jgi:hypothetical protein